MFRMEVHILILNAVVLSLVGCQQYDFAAEITRQCLVPDPVGLLDCVESNVDLPYMAAWVDCTNSLGENVATSRDIINYRCKSIWEGKGVIPEVFYIKDCVIEKMGLPGPNVSSIILGAYKECEKTAPLSNKGQSKKSSPALPNSFLQQQAIPVAPPVQQFQPPSSRQYFAIYPGVPMPKPSGIQQQTYSQQSISQKGGQFGQQQSNVRYQIGSQNQFFQQPAYQPGTFQKAYPEQVQQQVSGQTKSIVYQNPHSSSSGPYFYQFTSTHPQRKPVSF